MSPVTTHVLDTALGKPAQGIPVALELRQADGSWKKLGNGVTNNDGRATNLLSSEKFLAGTYRLTFDTSAYSGGRTAFFPQVVVVFSVADPNQDYHVPVLLSPFGYSTYRGS